MYDVIYYAKRGYDLVLSGKMESFPQGFFEFGRMHNEKIALAIFRYAFEYYMNWKPEQVKRIDIEILKRLQLVNLLTYISFPEELRSNKKENLFYIASLLYPREFGTYSFEERTIDLYKKVLDSSRKFPRNWFLGLQGKRRMCICLQYAIAQFLPPSESVKDLYEYFGKRGIVPFLQKSCLYNHQRRSYETPVDFLHDMLEESQQNSFLYDFWKFSYLKN